MQQQDNEKPREWALSQTAHLTALYRAIRTKAEELGMDEKVLLARVREAVWAMKRSA